MRWLLGGDNERAYHTSMDKEEHLRRHLELCKRIYERMKRDGTWPWADESDSSNSDGVIEFEDD